MTIDRNHGRHVVLTASAGALLVSLLASRGLSVPPPPTDPNQKPVAGAVAAAQPEAADVTVYRFQHTMTTNGFHYILATDAEGAPVKLLYAVENRSEILNVLGPQMGEQPPVYFEAQTANVAGHDVVQSVKLYKVLPCETSVYGFAFGGMTQKAVGAQSVSVILLKKIGRTFTVQIPNVRSPAGAAAPDPTLLAKVQALKEGDAVDIRLAKSTPASAKSFPLLATIEPYLDPIEGEYQGSGEIEVGGVKLKGIKLKVGDDVKVLPWATVDAAGKRVTHAALMPPKYQVGFPLRALMRHVGDQDEVKDVEYTGTVSPQGDILMVFLVDDTRMLAWDGPGILQMDVNYLNGQDDASRFIRGVQESTLTAAAHPELSAAQLNRLQQIENASQSNGNLQQAEREQLKSLYANFKKASGPAERWDAAQQIFLAIDLLAADHRVHQAQLATAGEQGLPPDVVKSMIALGSLGGTSAGHPAVKPAAPAGSSLLGGSDAPPEKP